MSLLSIVATAAIPRNIITSTHPCFTAKMQTFASYGNYVLWGNLAPKVKFPLRNSALLFSSSVFTSSSNSLGSKLFSIRKLVRKGQGCSCPGIWHGVRGMTIFNFLACSLVRKYSTRLTPQTVFTKEYILNLEHLVKLRFSSLSPKKPLDLSALNVPHDVHVYSHYNDQFYKMLSLFGLFQLAMFGYMSLYLFPSLKQPANTLVDTSQLPIWKRIFYGTYEYKNVLSFLSMAVGGVALFITVTYPSRIIRNLWILKGGKEVKVITYGWMGKTKTFQVPLEHISCMQSRASAGNYISSKIKGHNFYYLIDKQGSFHNTDLFDFVLGLKRNI